VGKQSQMEPALAGSSAEYANAWVMMRLCPRPQREARGGAAAPLGLSAARLLVGLAVLGLLSEAARSVRWYA